MRGSLSLAVAQPACVPRDVAANVAAHAALVRAAAARVVVFPELSLTGYELDARPLVVEDPRLIPLMAACGEMGSLALAGAPVRGEAGQAHIAVLAVDGSGATVAYRKQWLGGAEPQHFTAGSAPAVDSGGPARVGSQPPNQCELRHCSRCERRHAAQHCALEQINAGEFRVPLEHKLDVRLVMEVQPD